MSERERDLERVLTRVGSQWREEIRLGPGDTALCERLASECLARTATPLSVDTRTRRPLRRSAPLALACTVLGLTTWAVAAHLMQEPAEVQSGNLLTSAPNDGAPTKPRTRPRASEPIVVSEPTQDPAPHVRVLSEADTPSELLRRAGAARAKGEPARARDLYRRLAKSYPSSAEARVAHVALGRVLMDSLGDPDAALVEFDRYLRRPGALTEEALVGRAVALGRLGRRSTEHDTWRELLAKYPHSVHAARAQERLARQGGQRESQ